MLPVAQPDHRLLVARIGQQLVTADPLQRDDLAGGQLCCRKRPAQLGTTTRASDRLSVKAPVLGSAVLARALFAQREFAEGGVRPVVRNVDDDGVRGPPPGAVGERIPVSSLPGRCDLGQAVRAGGQVGQHRGSLRARLGFDDSEIYVPCGRQPGLLAGKNYGSRRPLAIESIEKLTRALPLNLDKQPLPVISYPALQIEFDGKAVYKGPEAHPLHRAANDYA